MIFPRQGAREPGAGEERVDAPKEGDGSPEAAARAVTVRFAYARDDLARAIRANFFAQPGIRFNTFVSVCLVAIGLWPRGDGASGGLALASLIAGASFMALLLAMWFFSPDIAMWREPKYRQSYDLTFSDAGVTFRKNGAGSTLPWSIYSRAVADGDGCLLYHRDGSWVLVPGRAFASSGDRAIFEALIAGHVPR